MDELLLALGICTVHGIRYRAGSIWEVCECLFGLFCSGEVGHGNLDISHRSSPEGCFVARARGRRELRVFCDTGKKMRILWLTRERAEGAYHAKAAAVTGNI